MKIKHIFVNMGFLTTITFRNDHAHHIQENPKEVMQIIERAMSGTCPPWYDNQYVVQKTRHSHDDTLYFHHGNTVIDVWEMDHEGTIDACIKEMVMQIKRLKALKKQMKNGKEQEKEA